MVLYSEFSSANGHKYYLEINAIGVAGEDKDVDLGGTPVILVTDSSKIFDPIKSRSLSIELVSYEWYFDLYQKTYSLLRQNGLTHKDLYHSANVENSIFDYFYDLDGDHLDIPRHEADRVHFVGEDSVASKGEGSATVEKTA